MWRALHLKRNQIQHLDVIRQRYPAVVDGQWIHHADSADTSLYLLGTSDPIARSAPPVPSMPDGRTGKGNGRSLPNGVRVENIGLQAELREVLTDAQLREWETICHTR